MPKESLHDVIKRIDPDGLGPSRKGHIGPRPEEKYSAEWRALIPAEPRKPMAKYSNGLTKAQEHLAYLVAICDYTLSDAYREAYNTKRQKATVIWAKASEISRKPHVKARINELRNARRDEIHLDTDSVLIRLHELSMQGDNLGVALAATKYLAEYINPTDFSSKSTNVNVSVNYRDFLDGLRDAPKPAIVKRSSPNEGDEDKTNH